MTAIRRIPILVQRKHIEVTDSQLRPVSADGSPSVLATGLVESSNIFLPGDCFR